MCFSSLCKLAFVLCVVSLCLLCNGIFQQVVCCFARRLGVANHIYLSHISSAHVYTVELPLYTYVTPLSRIISELQS